MPFSESPRFPENISYGASGGPVFNTIITINDGGYEQRLSRWQYPLHAYDVSHGARDQADIDTIKHFFMNVQGQKTGFRFKDWSDYTVTTAESNMAYSFGGIYQLGKDYVSGPSTLTRAITKPVDTTYAIYRDAVLQAEGAGAGEYAIDITTGIATFVPDATGVITGITQANPGVITDVGHGRSNGETIELSSIGGMTELNGQTVTVTVLTADTFSIGVDTTTYTAYTSGGVWEIFAQAGEVYTWSGEFDVPVRFGTDQMITVILDKNISSWGQIPLVELR